jgi:hypothetical protein
MPPDGTKTGRGRGRGTRGQTLRTRTTYRVGGSILLLGADDTTLSLSGIESGLATDDSLTLCGAGSSNTATNLGNGIPIVGHCDDVVEGSLGYVQGELSLMVEMGAFRA